jgi:uncharacterized protein (DUF1697 family)
MADTQYVALLRGINVGGKNLIKMADLKVCFEKHGFSEPATFIQSGNVLFGSSETNQTKLTSEIEKVLSKTFGYSSRVVLRSLKEMRATVAKAPKGFGSDPKTYRYYVYFLKEPLTGDEAIKNLVLKEGVDEVFAGHGVYYSTQLVSKLTQSRLNRVAGLPMYQNLTIRNWNTTTKLLALMEARGK